MRRLAFALAIGLFAIGCGGDDDAGAGDDDDLIDGGGGDDDDDIDGGGDDDIDAGGEEPACAFSACGGDPTGTWNISEACVEGSAFENPDCEKAAFDASGVEVSGTVTFGKDGSYEATGDITGTVVMSVPTQCVPKGTPCSDFDVEGTTCKDVAFGCECVQTRRYADRGFHGGRVRGNVRPRTLVTRVPRR
jgi:hypothetical protein